LVEVDERYQGVVIEALGARKGDMKDMKKTSIGTIRMNFVVPTRGLMGFRSEFLKMTRGTGVMYQNFYEYQPIKGEIPHRPSGVLISMSGGKAVAYALWGLQERGEIFVHPGDALYEGMIVGVNNKGRDLVVNATREKKLTNIRAASADEAIRLTPPREMTLEFALEFIEEDELVEITPKNIRLRKRHLTDNQRRAQMRVARQAT
ncbi:MAG: translational GTPase TypA, partial [Planctomycetes bacterium]|nr:translational GTPase TypA [Planctomycetota bacterium]